MSAYAAPIVRTAAEQAQMEPIMLELDSVRNALYWTDHKLQQNIDRLSWIEDALLDEALATLSEEIAQSIDSPTGEHQTLLGTIRERIEQVMVADLEERTQ